MPEDWKHAHDKAKEYIADLEKAGVKLRDRAIAYLERAEKSERELATARNDLLEEIAKEADKYPIGLTDFSRRIRAMKR